MSSAVRTLRIELGWTYTDLAVRAGLNRQTISKAEAGGSIEPGTAKKIADALGKAHRRKIKSTELGLNIK